MFLKACEPDFFCLKASSPTSALVWVSLLPPLLKFREVRSGLPFQGGTGTKHCTILSKMTPLANSSRPYPLDLAAWKCASNVLFWIICKINSLPRVVLKARLPLPQLFVARRNVTAVPALQRVAWGGSDLQRSVLPIPTAGRNTKSRAQKPYTHLCFFSWVAALITPVSWAGGGTGRCWGASIMWDSAVPWIGRMPWIVVSAVIIKSPGSLPAQVSPKSRLLVLFVNFSPWEKGRNHKRNLKKPFSLPAPKLPLLWVFKPRKRFQPCRVGPGAS